MAAHLSSSAELNVMVHADHLRGARGFKLGEDCIHFAGELLADALRGWGLSSAQDAGDRARLLEAPSPLVLMMVLVSPWLQR